MTKRSKIIQIDSDGMPFWNQYHDTHVAYGFNWYDRLRSIGNNPTIETAQLSSNVSSIVYGSSGYNETGHVFFVSPSAGNIGEEVEFTSKVFLTDGQFDKARLRIKVIS